MHNDKARVLHANKNNEHNTRMYRNKTFLLLLDSDTDKNTENEITY